MSGSQLRIGVLKISSPAVLRDTCDKRVKLEGKRLNQVSERKLNSVITGDFFEAVCSCYIKLTLSSRAHGGTRKCRVTKWETREEIRMNMYKSMRIWAMHNVLYNEEAAHTTPPPPPPQIIHSDLKHIQKKGMCRAGGEQRVGNEAVRVCCMHCWQWSSASVCQT